MSVASEDSLVSEEGTVLQDVCWGLVRLYANTQCSVGKGEVSTGGHGDHSGQTVDGGGLSPVKKANPFENHALLASAEHTSNVVSVL